MNDTTWSARPACSTRVPRWAVSTACWSLVVCATLAATASAGDAFDYFRNSWNVIGLKDYERGTRITPDNRLLIDGGEVRIRIGNELAALSRLQTKTLFAGWMPIVLLTAEEGAVRYEFTFWAAPLPGVQQWQHAYAWPTEGENYMNWIRVQVTNTGPVTAAGKVVLVETRGTDAARHARDFSLAPGGSAQAVFRIPFTATAAFPPDPAQAAEDAQAAGAEADLWLQRTIQFWQSVRDRAARIDVPCRKATETLLAAHVCQLIANDHGVMHGGEGFYDEFYIRDGGYQLMELEEAGLADAARQAVDHYLTCQRSDGRFESQPNQLDANGQALWTLWQYYKITGDRAWLEHAYGSMLRAVAWTRQARRATPADSPFAGLLPAAVADGEFLWDGKHHIVGYDLWNLRGILCTADAARILGRDQEAQELAQEAADYRAAIDAAWHRTGVSHFPPSWELVGTHWGNTETLWPTEIFDRQDPRVSAMIQHARTEQGGGFVEGTIQWLGAKDAIHPYLSAYTTMASLALGQAENVVEDFYWYLLHSSASHAFPEGIFYRRRHAWADTIPHVTGASNYALLLRHMLVHEQGDELHLLAAVPDGWLAAGQEIHVQNAPTHFGPLSLRVRGSAAGVEVEFQPPIRTAPERIVLHLPQSRPVFQVPEGIEVALRPDQKIAWDFDHVVRIYEASAPPVWTPIPHLDPLPPEPPVDPAKCRFLDLSALANTDPLTAPFGVPKAGNLQFTGLPLGRQLAAGIPFDILDPARNAGRAMVVLHSPRAPQDRTWPTQVEIPVGAQGRRLFFLGNVSGWGGSDDGVPPSGAVGEYEICYADGQRQVVPLIPGRTIEDWTAPPSAEDVMPGLRGDPWHLNVLAVTLRPVEVANIVFRDLETPAAPVLVAVTFESP